ncbi:MAG: hypothetical protein A2W53_08060 [Nitrospinae bacterium RIFCSPHIGHO2_02_39_11]|nr:MAG: hypothetical protein A2W53_08060 [Nitrospinae bacterium RIFCSPHIGHO2_02_39_11]
MRKKRRLLDEYQFPGFRPKAGIQGIFGDPKARVIRLKRTQKKQYAAHAEQFIGVITTRRCVGYGIYHAGMRESIWRWKSEGYYVMGAGK